MEQLSKTIGEYIKRLDGVHTLRDVDNIIKMHETWSLAISDFIYLKTGQYSESLDMNVKEYNEFLRNTLLISKPYLN